MRVVFRLSKAVKKKVYQHGLFDSNDAPRRGGTIHDESSLGGLFEHREPESPSKTPTKKVHQSTIDEVDSPPTAKPIAKSPQKAKTAKPRNHDVSGEARDTSGKWTKDTAKEPWEMTKEAYSAESAKASRGDERRKKRAFQWNALQKILAKNKADGLREGLITQRQWLDFTKKHGLPFDANNDLFQHFDDPATRGVIVKESASLAEKQHFLSVRDALAAGKPVPTEVLKDYPELTPGAKDPKLVSKAVTTRKTTATRKPHDVSDEARDTSGKWTRTGGTNVPPKAKTATRTPAEPVAGHDEQDTGPATLPHPTARAPRGVFTLPVGSIMVDPARFQFKRGLEFTQSGAGEELKGVKKWDDELAGVVSVWRDPANGKTYVVNGHHRVDLARRLKVRRMLVRYINAPDARSAMVKGALINIAEGRGDAISAAKVFRTARMGPKALDDAGISIKGALAGQAVALAALTEPLWKKVVSGDMDEGRGAAIGRAFPGDAEQIALDKMLNRPEVRRKRLSDAAIAELAKFVDTAGKRTKTIESLFGEEKITESLAVEKAQLSAAIKRRLGEDKRLFQYVSSGGRAGKLERAGNKMAHEENKNIAADASRVYELYDRLAIFKGPISDALNESAKEYAESGRPAPSQELLDRLYQRVRTAVQSELTPPKPAPAPVQQPDPAPPPSHGVLDVPDTLTGDLFGDHDTLIKSLPPGFRPGAKVMKVSEIHADPSRLQYRKGLMRSKARPDGADDRFDHINKWEPSKMGVLTVWRDPKDGKTYVVDGHHRLALAKRLGVDSVAVRYLSARSADEAKAKGEIMNDRHNQIMKGLSPGITLAVVHTKGIAA